MNDKTMCSMSLLKHWGRAVAWPVLCDTAFILKAAIRGAQTGVWAAWCWCSPVRFGVWPGPSLFPPHSAEHPELCCSPRTSKVTAWSSTETPLLRKPWQSWGVHPTGGSKTVFYQIGSILTNVECKGMSVQRWLPDTCGQFNLYVHKMCKNVICFNLSYITM